MDSQPQIRSINPADEQLLATFAPASPEQIEAALDAADRCFRSWRKSTFTERGQLMRRLAAYFKEHRFRLAALMTAEMGKPIAEAEAEVDKCAWVCDYYAEHAAEFLADQPRTTSATESYVEFTPLGVVLAVMPWNFPFWQVLRFAAPTLMAGNTGILKHASNVPQCALAIEEAFRASGFPAGAFQTLLLAGSSTTALVGDPRIAAVTLTGSELAGAQIAEAAGRAIKKAVLELGGSDAFIVLEDADIAPAVETAVRARFQNAGQSCIAAKRFIVVESVAGEFEDRFVAAVRGLRMGDPMDRAVQVGPLARNDLRDALEIQVRRSVEQGARLLVGGTRQPGCGYFFPPTVLTNVATQMPVSCEETFGPVAAILKVRDAADAVRVANDSMYGLGCSLWTSDLQRGRRLARSIEAGSVFINGMVASDPRLPFGGVKRSGYGRELSEYGIREFVNIQTVWIGPKVAT